MGAVLGFLKSYGVTVALVIIVGLLYQQNRAMFEQLKNPLIDPELLKKAIEAKEKPIVVNIAPQGFAGAPVPVNVYVRPPATLPPLAGAKPGAKPEVVPPKLVAESPAIYCKTKDECDRLYARAPQALTVDAQIRAGTLATVCLQPLDAAGGCPADKRFSGPLVEPITFTAQFVLAERGIFQALQVVGAPFEITRVRTETRIESQATIERRLPYHLGITPLMFLGGQALSGIEYQNWLFGGVYRINAGYGYPGLRGGVSWTLPIR